MSRFSCCCDWGADVLYPRGCTIEEITSCAQFPSGMASKWDLAVAGVVDNACPDCSTWNRSVILFHDSGCTFLSDFTSFFTAVHNVPPCELSNTANWIMTYGGTPARWLLIARVGGAFKQICQYGFTGTFDPLGPNTFTLESHSDIACTFPNELTLEPVCE